MYCFVRCGNLSLLERQFGSECCHVCLLNGQHFALQILFVFLLQRQLKDLLCGFGTCSILEVACSLEGITEIHGSSKIEIWVWCCKESKISWMEFRLMCNEREIYSYSLHVRVLYEIFIGFFYYWWRYCTLEVRK